MVDRPERDEAPDDPWYENGVYGSIHVRMFSRLAVLAADRKAGGRLDERARAFDVG